MKLRITALLLITTLLLSLLSSCQAPSKESRTDAILSVVAQLYNTRLSPGGTGGYVALEIPEDELFDSDTRARIEEWLTHQGVKLIYWTDLDGLIASGRADEWGNVHGGVLLGFSDPDPVSNREITFEAFKYRSGLCGASCTCTLTWDRSGVWSVAYNSCGFS